MLDDDGDKEGVECGADTDVVEDTCNDGTDFINFEKLFISDFCHCFS